MIIPNLLILLFLILGIVAITIQNVYLSSFIVGGFTGTYLAMFVLGLLKDYVEVKNGK
jgi:hypothetical protein